VYVPTTNAGAITESGVPAGNSPGVTNIGMSNGFAIYAVGSGNYVWSSPFVIPVVPAIITTTTNQTGTGSGAFYPGWTVVTNGSLIAGLSPSTATGNFSEEAPGRNVKSLTTATNLGLTRIAGTYGYTTSTNYVTCGNGTGPDGSSAGQTVIYTLPHVADGYNLTNLTVYGGWADNGRDQQAYTVYYSTATAPSNFIQLAIVNYTPSIASDIQSATVVTLTDSLGVLASNVAALKFDFASPPSDNGYCGYAAITVFGSLSLPPPPVVTSTISTLSSFVIGINNLSAGQGYMLQSTTNLATGVWSTVTNFISTGTTATFTNSTVNQPQQFYRIVGY
jgi:hypothetical protein